MQPLDNNLSVAVSECGNHISKTEKQLSIYLALGGVIVNYLRRFAANFQLFEQY